MYVTFTCRPKSHNVYALQYHHMSTAMYCYWKLGICYCCSSFNTYYWKFTNHLEPIFFNTHQKVCNVKLKLDSLTLITYLCNDKFPFDLYLVNDVQKCISSRDCQSLESMGPLQYPNPCFRGRAETSTTRHCCIFLERQRNRSVG